MTQLSLRATAAQEPDGGWIAHCLDLDLVEVGSTAQDAVRRLAETVGVQLWYAHEHDNLDYLFRSAPPEAWSRLAAILKGPHETMVVPIKDKETQLEAQLAA